MKKLRRILMMVSLICGLSLVSSFVKAELELSPILKADGTNLKYRGTSTNVMGLTNYQYKVQDFRSVWVATVSNLDIGRQQSIESYKEELRTIISDIKSWGMNAIIFQIRPMNDAFYDSELNHWSLFLNNGQDPGWDMLTWFINECHEAGLEFHAWLNPYRVAGSDVTTLEAYAQSVAQKNALYSKNNLASDPNMLLKTAAGGAIFNPGEPAVRQFLIDTVREIVEKYDVDAIHFDDYFYASLENDSADNITMQKYPIAGINNKADWRRDQVTTFIRDLSTFLRNFNQQNNRVVQLGISPTGIWANKSSNPDGSNTAGFEHYGHYLYADTRKWVKNNYLDYILPQTYWGLEHTSAPFADLAKWWAETVRGTQVNLYLGNGLYMERPGYDRADWVNKPNEIDNQLKVMGVYPEIQGYCFFRYGTVKTVSPQYISGYNGIQLIKNDYWKKLIPSAPLKQYAHVVTDAPTFFRSGNSFRWDQVDNARGYVIYQVPKGVILDQNNPDHIYTYQAGTTIDLNVNTQEYDIYVASVSKANNISVATKYEFSLDTAEDINRAINALPNPVSLEDQSTVLAIRAAFNQLSPADQALITNYQKLVTAENQINTLLALKAEADRISSLVPRQITYNYLLPTTSVIDATVTWRYASGEDQSLYDINTGELLKRKITVSLRDFELEVSKNGFTYTKVVTINFSNLSEDKIGLYYYNSPSSILKDEEGNATFLDFSGKVIEINNYVLFIPKGNYMELMDTSNLITQWVSCAVVFYNVSGHSLTFRQGDTRIESTYSGYGYIIIGTNGLIKTIGTSYDPNNMITLEAGEYLFAPKYLDSQINGSPFKPVTNFSVGQAAKIYDFFSVITVQDIINAIDQIPTNLTLNDEAYVLELRAKFNSLSLNDQVLVTNYQKLVDAENTIEALKAAESLEAQKQAAINTLNGIDLSIYSPANQQIITNMINEAISRINSAVSVEEVQALLNETLDDIDEVLTLEEEAALLLESQKQEALQKLNNYVDLKEYTTIKQATILSLINNATNLINGAQSKAEIDTIVDQTKLAIDEIPTIAEEEAALENYKQAAIHDVENYPNLENYRESRIAQIQALIQEAIQAINEAKSYEEVDELVISFKTAVDAIPTKVEDEAEELAEYIDQKIDELKNYVKIDRYTTENQEAIREIIDNYEEQMRSATSKQEVDNLLKDAKADINAVPKKSVGSSCQFSSRIMMVMSIFVSISTLVFLFIRHKS